LNPSASDKRVWHVLFCKSRSTHWLLDKLEMGHVLAMRLSPGGTMWTIIDPTTSIIEAKAIPVEMMPRPEDYSDAVIEVVRVVVEPEALKPFKLGFGVLSCVTVIKYLLGIDKWFMWTPKQLFNHLKGQGHG